MPIRKRAGLITIVLWAAALICWLQGAGQLWEGALLRTAVVMTLLWSAWPQLVRLPRWIFFAVPLTCIAAALRPRILVVLVPLFLICGILRSKPHNHP